MSMLLVLDSFLPIRDGTNINELTILSELFVDVFSLGQFFPEVVGDNFRSSIRSGNYTSSGHFEKCRGRFVDGNASYPVEIISATSCWSREKIPLIVRVWNTEFELSEYLITENVISFRKMVSAKTAELTFDIDWNENSTVKNSIFSKLINSFIQNVHGNVDFQTRYMLGIDPTDGSICPLLTPNLTRNEYCNKVGQLVYGPSMITSIDVLLEEFYRPFGNVNNLISAYGSIVGKIPIRKTDNYSSVGTYANISGVTINTEIANTKQYEAIRLLMSIPYDHFRITIYLVDECRIDVEEIGTMCGYNSPYGFDTKLIELSWICQEFLGSYFEIHFPSDNATVYSDYVDGKIYTIDIIDIERTMDDIIILDIVADGSTYSRTFDTIFLSLLSPVIGN